MLFYGVSGPIGGGYGDGMVCINVCLCVYVCFPQCVPQCAFWLVLGTFHLFTDMRMELYKNIFINFK